MAKNELSDEDKELFRRYVETVKPPCKKEEATPSNLSKPLDVSLSNYVSESITADTILSFAQAGVPSKQLRALKNGQQGWHARLDLHGSTVEEAQEKMLNFLNHQYQAKTRCVLIIHGKGGRHHQQPILKGLVNHWLKQIPYVLAFHSAIPKDGGSGAVYVLLKRSRD